MPPGHQHVDQVLGDFSLGKEHPEDLVAEDRLQVFELECRCNSEHAITVKTAIRAKNVAVGIKPVKTIFPSLTKSGPSAAQWSGCMFVLPYGKKRCTGHAEFTRTIHRRLYGMPHTAFFRVQIFAGNRGTGIVLSMP